MHGADGTVTTNGGRAMGETSSKAIELVMSVLADGQRTDRYLSVSGDGRYYTTPDDAPPAVKIPVSYDGTEEDDRAWAVAIVAELDALVAGE